MLLSGKGSSQHQLLLANNTSGGVSGITSAYLLSKSKGNTITVVSKHMPGDYDIEYASPFAGANVLPYVPQTQPPVTRLTAAA